MLCWNTICIIRPMMLANSHLVFPTSQKPTISREETLTLTGDHSIVSNMNAAGGGGIGHSNSRKKSVEDYEKEEESSFSVLKTIEEELHQSLSYWQSMLSVVTAGNNVLIAGILLFIIYPFLTEV